MKRVYVIRGLDHIGQLPRGFAVYHNEHRGHTKLGGAVASVIHRGEHWSKPEKFAKTLPSTIVRRIFPDIQITAYRLAARPLADRNIASVQNRERAVAPLLPYPSSSDSSAPY